MHDELIGRLRRRQPRGQAFHLRRESAFGYRRQGADRPARGDRVGRGVVTAAGGAKASRRRPARVFAP